MFQFCLSSLHLLMLKLVTNSLLLQPIPFKQQSVATTRVSYREGKQSKGGDVKSDLMVSKVSWHEADQI